jgi:hypothetical protein
VCFCSDECAAAYGAFAASNPWLGPDSAAAAGPLTEALVLRCLRALPERPHWFRVAQTCAGLWRLVSRHRAALRLPAAARAPRLDGAALARLLGRSGALRHVDFGGCVREGGGGGRGRGERRGTSAVCREQWAGWPAAHVRRGARGAALSPQPPRRPPRRTHIACRRRGRRARRPRACAVAGVGVGGGRCDVATDAVLRALGASCPRLETLSLRGCAAVTDLGLEAAAAGCPALERLDAAHCAQLSDDGLAAAAAAGLARLRLLSLAHCPLVAEPGLAAVAARCRRLGHLDVSGCPRVTDGALRALLRGCAGLFHLGVRGCVGLSAAELRRAERQVARVDGLPWRELVPADLSEPARLDF